MRAADDIKHTQFLSDMGKPNSNWTSSARAHLHSLKFLQHEDFLNGFERALVVVTNNNERVGINKLLALAYAIRHGKSRFSWKLDLTSRQAVNFLKVITLKAFQDCNPILTSYFVKGAPGFLLANINP